MWKGKENQMYQLYHLHNFKAYFYVFLSHQSSSLEESASFISRMVYQWFDGMA